MNGKKKRKKLYPHKWVLYKALPAEVFEPLPFDVFMDWRVSGWVLPDNVFCIIRTTHTVTKKIKEYTYKKPSFAQKKMEQLASDPDLEICITTNDEQLFYKGFDLTDEEINF
ncbi:MAG: hypothetical protein CBC48_15555 [bacterium TMED88]|nr:MAG: hypothetical protein CBC48_15555 [bacterium TMED88]